MAVAAAAWWYQALGTFAPIRKLPMVAIVSAIVSGGYIVYTYKKINRHKWRLELKLPIRLTGWMIFI